ncbi:pirin family protein [Asticcacaulis tiandongensis]|uniref:pirin family protein n=1 Tax=Asticcacaulis tiandongensis TaxID=2565365 RepID=UPI00112B0B17|nr:pirin family protein [Asticcacaulis tiandongensis]
MSTTPRSVTRIVRGQPATDGAGVKLNRVLGTQALPEVDPFLMLDEFRSDDPTAYIAGFPDHPHRGFETITYMLAGRMRHRDSKGNEGLLGPGDVQWMTTARGLVHSEMPEQEDGLMQGFQLWLNLPASEKMFDPAYKDVPADTIPVIRHTDVSVKLLAGQYQGQSGPIASPTTKPFIADVTLEQDADIAIPVPADHAGFIYVHDGAVNIGQVVVERGQAAVLTNGDQLPLIAGLDGAKVLVVLGKPLGEPIARHGPFVMNTPEEIYQAFADFRAGKF